MKHLQWCSLFLRNFIDFVIERKLQVPKKINRLWFWLSLFVTFSLLACILTSGILNMVQCFQQGKVSSFDFSAVSRLKYSFSTTNAKAVRMEPVIKITKALLKCMIDNRGFRFRCWSSSIHFKGNGTYHFSHSPRIPISFNRKILRHFRTKLNYISFQRNKVWCFWTGTNSRQSGHTNRCQSVTFKTYPWLMISVYGLFLRSSVNTGELQNVSFVMVYWQVPVVLRSASKIILTIVKGYDIKHVV